MPRTVLSPTRLAQTRNPNIGKVIIFCEGGTEEYYFDYFVRIIERGQNAGKFTDIHVKTVDAGGDARRVLNKADEYMSCEEYSLRFGLYSKYLVFDCDKPKDIQSVINDARTCGGYELLITNYLFETWLLVHFENVDEKISKKNTYSRLSEHLHAEYKKNRKGITREIITNGSVEQAIDNAARLNKRYTDNGLNMYSDIKDMNPYSSVYTLIEQLMAVIS